MNEKHDLVVEFPKEGCVNIAEGQSVLDAALSSGIPLFHVCGGKGKCSTCRVLVIEGHHFLNQPTTQEQLLKTQINFPPNVRLACQTQVIGGPVKVQRIIQDETDIGLYIGNGAGDATQELGIEKEMALFFLDIRNFTKFVETHLAFDVIHIIRKLFSVFQRIIETNGGKIVETAGDGIYAVFSDHMNKTQCAHSAVQSALSILDNIEQLNATYFQSYFRESIQVGIGIHIGNVITGSVHIGTEDRTIVMGLPVNVAARLQNATKELNNSLIISKPIYDLLENSPIVRKCNSIVLKGITDPITVFLLGKPYS